MKNISFPNRRTHVTFFSVIISLLILFNNASNITLASITNSKIIHSTGRIRATIFGVIIYHETMGYKFTTHEDRTTIIQRLTQVTDRIILYTQPKGWVQWGLNQIVMDFTNIAKSEGLRVGWALRDEGFVDDNWTQYRDFAFLILNDAESAGVDEVWVGVEHGFRLRNWSQDESVDAILQLIQDSRQYFSGDISYDSSAWAELNAWASVRNDSRFPSKLFFSVYENFETWKSKVDTLTSLFEDKFRIGEWGSKMNLNGEEGLVDNNFTNKMNYILSKRIAEAYVFCYRENESDPLIKSWGLWTGSTDQPKPSWFELSDYFS